MKGSLKGEEGNEGAYAFGRKMGYHSGGKEGGGERKNEGIDDSVGVE